MVDWLKRGVYEELRTMYDDVVWAWLPDEEKRRGAVGASEVKNPGVDWNGAT